MLSVYLCNLEITWFGITTRNVSNNLGDTTVGILNFCPKIIRVYFNLSVNNSWMLNLKKLYVATLGRNVLV